MLRSAGRIGSIGIEFSMAVILCLLAGRWADERYGTDPCLTLAGIVLGTTVGFVSMARAVRNSNRENDPPPRDP